VYLQFEICEDALDDEVYYSQVMSEAKELCARWCKEFGIPPENVASHWEAHARGYASNHSDIDHWLKKFGDSMDDFREDVRVLLEKEEEEAPPDDAEATLLGLIGDIEDYTAKINEKLGEIREIL